MNNRNILSMIKEGYYVNCDMEFVSSPDIYKKYREIKKIVEEKGLNRERLEKLTILKELSCSV